MLENLVKLTQRQSSSNTLVHVVAQGANGVGSEQPSPAVSDSQTSGSSAHITEVAGHVNNSINSKKCSNCKVFF